MRLKAIVRLIAAIAVTAAASMATAAPAQAAEPTCNGKTTAALVSGEGYSSIVPAYNGNKNCSMNPGLTSEGVRALQRNLNKCYEDFFDIHYTQYNFSALEEDGQFGTATKNALIKVQQYLQISPDGGYGPQTRSQMVYWNGQGGVSGQGPTFVFCYHLL